ncbi:hypothetical protein HHK36_020470 [Tetracentron sinense]|uniref:NAC domain-containing protein n=1 Tax=Tetracentron sinense TaxID=13715 RepID=A0A835D818_TETSI|nr:hypothetical protein HHK36_020470 [Tetracentron sinense]
MVSEVAKFGAKEWYFFSFRDRKYANGFRANRATMSGYWKATGKDRPVLDPTTHAIVGMRKSLVFYRNRAPKGIKTCWVMHEFRLENPSMPPKEDWVLCRVFHKSKGEHITNLGLQNELETTNDAFSPNFTSSPPTDQTMPSWYQQVPSFPQIAHHQDHSPSPLLNLASINPNLLEFPNEVKNTTINNSNSKGDDGYGFLLDMSLEDNCLGDGGLQYPDDMRFEDDYSIILI